MAEKLGNLQVNELLEHYQEPNDIELEDDFNDQAESEASWGNKRLNFKQHNRKPESDSIDSFEIEEGPVQKSPTGNFSQYNRKNKMRGVIKP